MNVVLNEKPPRLLRIHPSYPCGQEGRIFSPPTRATREKGGVSRQRWRSSGRGGLFENLTQTNQKSAINYNTLLSTIPFIHLLLLD